MRYPRREDGTNTDLKQIRCNGVDRTHVAHHSTAAGSREHGNEP